MWIRSVFGEILVNVEIVKIDFNEESSGYDVFVNDVRVAKYSTRALALQVMNDIQKFLEESLINQNIGIYQMPKEDRETQTLCLPR